MTSFWDQNAQRQEILSQSEPRPEGKCRGGIRETSSRVYTSTELVHIVLSCGTPKNTIQTPRGVLLKDHTLF